MFKSGWSLVPWPGLTPSLRYWTYSTGVSQGALIGSGFKGSMWLIARRFENQRALEQGSLAHSTTQIDPRRCCSIICGSNVSEGA
jgi:hypothetical protein